MMRILFVYVLPLLFPAAVYFLWMKLRAPAKNNDAEPKEDPWFWLLLIGFLMVGAALAFTALRGEKITGGSYEPDRLEGGRIVPGRINPLRQ